MVSALEMKTSKEEHVESTRRTKQMALSGQVVHGSRAKLSFRWPIRGFKLLKIQLRAYNI